MEMEMIGVQRIEFKDNLENQIKKMMMQASLFHFSQVSQNGTLFLKWPDQYYKV